MRDLIKIILLSAISFVLSGCVSQDVSNSTLQEVMSDTGITEQPGKVVMSDVGEKPSQIRMAVSADEIELHMDHQDRLYQKDAMFNNKINKGSHWSNAKQGIEYTVMPISEFKSNGTACRRSFISAKIDGVIKQAYMTVCGNSDDKERHLEKTMASSSSADQFMAAH